MAGINPDLCIGCRAARLNECLRGGVKKRIPQLEIKVGGLERAIADPTFADLAARNTRTLETTRADLTKARSELERLAQFCNQG